jgi:hypothetical protein
VVLSSRLLSTCTTALKGAQGTPDISHILMCYWFESVLYLDPVARFPETTEKDKPGFFVGFADNVGDALTFKILKDDLSAVLHRSVVRSAADPLHRNKRVTFKPEHKRSWRNWIQYLVLQYKAKINLSRDQESPMLMFLIEQGPRQAI